jgi:hypothetical protein
MFMKYFGFGGLCSDKTNHEFSISHEIIPFMMPNPQVHQHPQKLWQKVGDDIDVKFWALP